MSNIVEGIEDIVDELRELEADDERPLRLFTIRRRLKAVQHEYNKQGDRIPVTKKFVIRCCECSEEMLRQDDYYLHLRKEHNCSDEEASKKTIQPLTDYEQGIAKLKELLAEFTQTPLNDQT